jgi:hypothetical protein
MIIVLQFPLCDARPFRPGQDRYRLTVPDWPSPATEFNPQFVHFFGKAVQRRREADLAWADEASFCLGHRAIRFRELGLQWLGLPGSRIWPSVAFRRLFCDGQAVVRLEVGLIRNPRTPKIAKLDAASVLACVVAACELDSWVPEPGSKEANWKPLLRQGNALARLYSQASTILRRRRKVSQPSNFVLAGSPLIIVELEPREEIAPPEGFTNIDPEKAHGALMSFGRLQTHVGMVGVWIMQAGRADFSRRRSLRLCLLRLHAEQEALDLILKHIKAKRILQRPDNNVAEDLNRYLDKRTWLIQRDQFAGVSQSAILAALDAADEVTPPATRRNFTERFQGARRQVWLKIEDYQARRAAIRLVPITYIDKSRKVTHVNNNPTINQSGSGVVIVNLAEYMENVSNVVNQNLHKSGASPNIEALVKKLTQQIQELVKPELAKKVDPQQTQQMGNDLETLSKELANPQPRRKWYQLSLEGIKEAATTIGEVGAPILETVKALWPLLLGS